MEKQRVVMSIGFFLLGLIFAFTPPCVAVGQKVRIVILDKPQHSVIPTARLTVYDPDGKPVEVLTLSGEYVVALPDAGTYTYDASAVGYLPVRGARLERPASGVVQVLLTRRKGPGDTQTVAFVAKDAYTGKPIGARFRVKNTEFDKTTTPTVTTAAHPEFGTELNIQQRYLLTVSAEDYEEYTASILIKEKEPEPVRARVILLRPLVHEVSFTFRDGVGLEFIHPDRFQVWESGKEIATRLEGDVAYAKLRAGKDYQVMAEKEGYARFEHLLKFRMPQAPVELTKSILMMKGKAQETSTNREEARQKDTPDDAGLGTAAVGEAVRLSRVYFDQSSYILTPESYPQLNRLVEALKKNPRLRIEIGGHTDNVGDARLNQYLSENRAKVIANYLENQGIDERQLLWKGYGQTRPIAPNDTEDNRAKNRRVEVTVMEK
jgi:outer membrane protein OmpA-like peptidoglycan-associated protein